MYDYSTNQILENCSIGYILFWFENKFKIGYTYIIGIGKENIKEK